jgi:hypothetical protein
MELLEGETLAARLARRGGRSASPVGAGGATPPGVGTVTELRLVVNWFDELKRIAPPK